MLHELKLSPAHAVEVLPEWSSNDLRLQIDVRLRLADGAVATNTCPETGRPTPEELLRVAAGIYDARRKRDKIAIGELFGEPAWDMLLALYCLPARGEKLGVTALSYAANVPQSTGHRVQAVLAERGLIERTTESSDARRQLVWLTEKARTILENYFTSLFFANQSSDSRFGVAAA